MKVTAIIAAYNEADIIEPCLAALIDDGVDVYLIDDGSTDDTVARAERFLGRGLSHIERLEDVGSYSQRRLMRRKEELARTLPGDWFISHDADEFREGPWRGLNLRDSIGLVDRLGYNAVDFELLNFWPTRDLLPGEDPRSAFHHFERGESFNRIQLRCWKRAPDIDIATSLGHEARFAGRRIFPMRFLLRHYPLRGRAHGEQKLYRDRLPRFDAEERAGGYHVQYEPFVRGDSLLRDSSTMEEFDPDLIRAQLQLQLRSAQETDTLEDLQQENRALRKELAAAADWARQLNAEITSLREDSFRGQEELARAAEWTRELQAEIAALHSELEAVITESTARQHHLATAEQMLTRLQTHASESEQQSEAVQNELVRAGTWSQELRAEIQDLRRNLTVESQRRAMLEYDLAALRESLSWRLTGPARALVQRWRGK